ncbi:MAG: restriction endonuclease subunit S [Coprococcus catus]|nr:restriction endonuclease subunit S [Coprococcus catus]
MKFKHYYIAELLSEISMGPFGSNIKKECFVDSGIPVLNGSNLTDVAMNDDAFRYVTKEKADSLGRANAQRGDVVVTHRGTLGQISFIPKDSMYDRYVISQSQFRFRCNEKVIPEYLVYYFHTRKGQHDLLSNASQVGVPALARATTTFQQLEIDLPEIEEQRKIVEILEDIRRKIELNKEINNNLEQQAVAVFNKFYDASTNQQPFTTLINVLGGGTPKTGNPEFWDGSIPFFTPKDVGTPYTFKTEKYITELGLKHCNSRLYPTNTTFVTARGTVGKISLAGAPMAMNQSCYALTNDIVDPLLVYFYVLKAVNALKHKASGAVFDAIVTRDFDGEIINILSDADSEAALSIIKPMMEAIHNNSKENMRLSAVRDTLLPKLMSGELDVSDLDL